jgi:hypothetical protein
MGHTVVTGIYFMQTAEDEISAKGKETYEKVKLVSVRIVLNM